MCFAVDVFGVICNRRADADIRNGFVFGAVDCAFCGVNAVTRDNKLRRENLIYCRQSERSSEPLPLADGQGNTEFSAEKVICFFYFAFLKKPAHRR